MLKVLAQPGMRLYFLGNTLSTMGDYALWLAAGVWVKELTGSTAQAGLCMLCLTLGTLCAPLTGALVDRVRRRPLILVTNSATGLLVLSLLVVRHGTQVWLVFAVMFLYGLLAAPSRAAMSALLPRMVGGADLGTANGLTQALTQGQRLVTPALGVGLLAGFGGGAVALFDAATFAAAVVCWWLIKVDDDKPGPTETRQSWWRDTVAGFTFLARTPILRQLNGAMTVALFVMGFFETLGIAIATVGLHHSPTWVGVITTSIGVTGVLGGVMAGGLNRRLGPIRLPALGLALSGAAATLLAVRSDGVVVVAALLLGLGLPFVITGVLTAVQTNTPDSLLGRVSSANSFLLTGGQSLGISVGAALISVLYYAALCYVAAGALGLSALYLVTRPDATREIAVPSVEDGASASV